MNFSTQEREFSHNEIRIYDIYRCSKCGFQDRQINRIEEFRTALDYLKKQLEHFQENVEKNEIKNLDKASKVLDKLEISVDSQIIELSKFLPEAEQEMVLRALKDLNGI